MPDFTHDEKLTILLDASKAFERVTYNELRIMLWLRKNGMPCPASNLAEALMERFGMAKKTVQNVTSELKQKGMVNQRGFGALFLTGTGNRILDEILVEI